jgi:hypothetical protein
VSQTVAGRKVAQALQAGEPSPVTHLGDCKAQVKGDSVYRVIPVDQREQLGITQGTLLVQGYIPTERAFVTKLKRDFDGW